MSSTCLLAAQLAVAASDQIGVAVRDLGGEDFAVREAAERRLLALGLAAAPAVELAARSTDPEVRLRARGLLPLVTLGITRSTPPDFARSLMDFVAGRLREAPVPVLAHLVEAYRQAGGKVAWQGRLFAGLREAPQEDPAWLSLALTIIAEDDTQLLDQLCISARVGVCFTEPEVQTALDAALADDNPQLRLCSRLLQRFWLTGQPEKSAQVIAAMLRLQPELNDFAMYAGLQAAEDRGDWCGLIDLATHLLQFRQLEYLSLKRAMAHVQLGDCSLAMLDYEEILERRPDATEALCNLGCIYVDLGQPLRARQMFERVLCFDPNDEVTLHNLGVMAAQDGHYDEAVKLYQRALAANARYVKAYQSLAVTELSRDNYAAALVAVNQALAIREDAWTLSLRGQVFWRLSRLDEAVVDFDAAISLDPTLADAHFVRGWIHALQGQYEPAAVDLDGATRFESKYDEIKAQAFLAYASGNYQAAAGQFGQLAASHGDWYATVWQHLAARRSGRLPAASLAHLASNGAPTTWQQAVADLLLGRGTAGSCRALARSDAERCKVSCYIGIHLLLQGDRAAAARVLREAGAMRVVTAPEYLAAVAELRRLE